MDPDDVLDAFDRIRGDHRATVDRLRRQLADEDRARELSGEPAAGGTGRDRMVPGTVDDADDEPLRGRRWLRNSW